MMIVAVSMRSQTASHWNCDIYAYQYDMTIYLQLTSYGKILTDYSSYEIAVFSDDECRGVATFLPMTLSDDTKTTIARIRVRSNLTEEENLFLKVYNTSTGKEENIVSSPITFQNNSVLGMPSSPYLLELKKGLIGDVNGDGGIDVADIICIANHILGKTPATFDVDAADINSDGEIDVADIISIANVILHGKSEAKIRQTESAVEPQ